MMQVMDKRGIEGGKAKQQQVKTPLLPLCIAIIFGMFAVACQSSGGVNPIETQSASPRLITPTHTSVAQLGQTAISTPQKSTATQVILPTGLPVISPTTTPKPKATSTRTAELFQISPTISGKLFIASTGGDMLVDFNLGTLTKLAMNLCSAPSPGSMLIVCENKADIYDIYDISTGEWINSFAYPGSCKLGWSSDGKYFYLGVGKCEIGESLQVVRYGGEGNLETVISQYLYGRWQWIPTAFSAYGEHFVEIRENAAFEITSKGEQALFSSRLALTGDFAWAPVSQRFLFGVTDIQQEIRPMPNFLYMYDFETRQFNQITALEQGFYQIRYPWQAWTSNEKYVAVSTGSGFCIIDMETKLQQCPQNVLPAGSKIIAQSWSPNNHQIAWLFIDQQTYNCKLSVYDVLTGKSQIVLSDLEKCQGNVYGIFWR